jgi:hypothetical protein
MGKTRQTMKLNASLYMHKKMKTHFLVRSITWKLSEIYLQFKKTA